MSNKQEENKTILENKVIKSCYFEETFMRGYKLYSHNCQASLRTFFTKVPDKIYPNMVKEFYSNLYVIGKTETSSVKTLES